MICMLHLMKLSSHVRWLIFCSVLNVLVVPPPLELIQLPAKKHSLTTYKEKKNPYCWKTARLFSHTWLYFCICQGIL